MAPEFFATRWPDVSGWEDRGGGLWRAPYADRHWLYVWTDGERWVSRAATFECVTDAAIDVEAYLRESLQGVHS